MRHKRFILLLFIFAILSFIVIKDYSVVIASINPNLWQAITLLIMLIAIAIPFQQVYRIEEDKTLIAIISLIEELEYNRKLLEEYIEHSENGCNIHIKDDKISWEWNKPKFYAYERYLVTACRGDLIVAKEITDLYYKLDSCKVIIETVQTFVAHNLLQAKFTSFNIVGAMDAFRLEISKNNKQLYDISKEAVTIIDGLINKLEGLKNSKKSISE
jgi:hypothetical protein